MRLLVAGLLIVSMSACAEVLPIAPRPAVAEASDDLFLLVVRSPADRHPTGQPIDVFAELLYQGPKNSETIFHASSPIFWQIVQLDGPAVMEGGMDMPCLSTDLQAGAPKRYPFEKAGVVEDVPPFNRAWFEEDALRLPAGRWRFVATLSVSLGDCGGEPHELEASVDLVVGP
ncbi:MAG: hypothetical protein H0V87_02000 [Chloroflexi bacterium]|nr:hypothetical protein [Chloroflexota bacterium]